MTEIKGSGWQLGDRSKGLGLFSKNPDWQNMGQKGTPPIPGTPQTLPNGCYLWHYNKVVKALVSESQNCFSEMCIIFIGFEEIFLKSKKIFFSVKHLPRCNSG